MSRAITTVVVAAGMIALGLVVGLFFGYAVFLALRDEGFTRFAAAPSRTLDAGGVPVRPAYKRRHRSRADIVLLCDMSGSVAGFSRFTMMLLQSLAGVFRRVRFIGFVPPFVTDCTVDVVQVTFTVLPAGVTATPGTATPVRCSSGSPTSTASRRGS